MIEDARSLSVDEGSEPGEMMNKIGSELFDSASNEFKLNIGGERTCNSVNREKRRRPVSLSVSIYKIEIGI